MNTTLCRLTHFQESLQIVPHDRTYTIKSYSTSVVTKTFKFFLFGQGILPRNWNSSVMDSRVSKKASSSCSWTSSILCASNCPDSLLCQRLHYGKPFSGYFLSPLFLAPFLIASEFEKSLSWSLVPKSSIWSCQSEDFPQILRCIFSWNNLEVKLTCHRNFSSAFSIKKKKHLKVKWDW